MRPTTPKALPFRARERNRLMLAAALVIMAPVAGLATGAFVTSQSSPRTLLTAVDDMPLGQPQDSPAVESSASPQSNSEIHWFNGRPVRPVRTMSMLVTAYSPDARSCGASADNITASGYSVWTNGMKMAAAGTTILPVCTM